MRRGGDGRLARLIEDYESATRIALALFECSGLQLPKSGLEWALRKIPQHGVLADGSPYFKHGIGCEVTFPVFVLDFDFGHAGEIVGPDAWRLYKFSRERLNGYSFNSRREIESAFDDYVATNLRKSVSI